MFSLTFVLQHPGVSVKMVQSSETSAHHAFYRVKNRAPFLWLMGGWFPDFDDFLIELIDNGGSGASPIRTSVWCSPAGGFFHIWKATLLVKKTTTLFSMVSQWFSRGFLLVVLKSEQCVPAPVDSRIFLPRGFLLIFLKSEQRWPPPANSPSTWNLKSEAWNLKHEIGCAIGSILQVHIAELRLLSWSFVLLSWSCQAEVAKLNFFNYIAKLKLLSWSCKFVLLRWSC